MSGRLNRRQTLKVAGGLLAGAWLGRIQPMDSHIYQRPQVGELMPAWTGEELISHGR